MKYYIPASTPQHVLYAVVAHFEREVSLIYRRADLTTGRAKIELMARGRYAD